MEWKCVGLRQEVGIAGETRCYIVITGMGQSKLGDEMDGPQMVNGKGNLVT